MGASDERVLSYGDVLLRQSDVSLLDGPHFLNDQIIEFFFNYLSNQYSSSSNSRQSGSLANEHSQLTPLLLVGPTLTFWLLHCPDAEGLMAAINPMRFHEREMVIFALNNNEDVETAEGGTHWTLLMFNRQRNSFEHFDSMSGTNNKQARDFVDIIKCFMGPLSVASSMERRVDAVSVACLPTRVSPITCGCGDGSSVAVNEGVSGARFIEQATPQQENSYDCGVYVMAIAQVLCNAFQERKRIRSRSNDYAGLVRSSISPTSVNKMRYTTMELIHSLSTSDETRMLLRDSCLDEWKWLKQNVVIAISV